MQVGAAIGLQVADVFLGVRGLGVLDHGLLAELLDGAGVVDDVEGLALGETVDDLDRGVAGLLDLLAAHGAGAVDDHDDFTLLLLVYACFRLGRDTAEE